MCGIFGVISSGAARCRKADGEALIQLLYRLSESRGKEAAGAALLRRERLDVVKAPVRGRDFLKLPEAVSLIGAAAGELEAGRPFAVMGHTRMVTNGGDHVHGNNQPVIRDGLVAIHNGIIVNDAALWTEMPEATRRYEVDTEVVLALVAQQPDNGKDLPAALAAAMRATQGANTIALMSAAHDGLVLATSNGSMYYLYDKTAGVVVFASERSILETVVEKGRSFLPSLATAPVSQLVPGDMATVPMEKPAPLLSRWKEDSDHGSLALCPARAVADHPAASLPAPKPFSAANLPRLSEIEKLTQVDQTAIRALRRCTRCVLPETFPFITFDEQGVCNHCRSHEPLAPKGADVLRRELDLVRRADGRPEVLFPLSGGRDSCYGLHLLVREYGIKPVAYTYDWGMVTDLARRNISRMCGALGIEHVLISADIRQKRAFVRKNVSAWLRKPHLGTVPLFMAGDKQFFYYANKLKKEMGLARTLFSMNPLERTDFKVGFCGIDEAYHKEKHYDPRFVNKLRLGLFYAKEMLSNPAYLNDSLIDSVFAYFSYYMIPKDYASLFDYLPWIEKDVESTLLGQYDWELSPDTKSTWRIGDGTASFYNYIYYRVAGFSENDTFRSNQIREGLITREDAMARIEEENAARCLSMAWYGDTIGIDMAEAVRTINKIPTLY